MFAHQIHSVNGTIVRIDISWNGLANEFDALTKLLDQVVSQRRQAKIFTFCVTRESNGEMTIAQLHEIFGTLTRIPTWTHVLLFSKKEFDRAHLEWMFRHLTTLGRIKVLNIAGHRIWNQIPLALVESSYLERIASNSHWIDLSYMPYGREKMVHSFFPQAVPWTNPQLSKYDGKEYDYVLRHNRERRKYFTSIKKLLRLFQKYRRGPFAFLNVDMIRYICKFLSSKDWDCFKFVVKEPAWTIKICQLQSRRRKKYLCLNIDDEGISTEMKRIYENRHTWTVRKKRRKIV